MSQALTYVQLLDGAAPGPAPGMRQRWQLDTIHNTPADRLLYRPSVVPGQGVYIMQMGDRLTAGSYDHAIPHIGEGLFEREWEATYCSVESASLAAWHCMNLLDGRHHEMELLQAITGFAKPSAPAEARAEPVRRPVPLPRPVGWGS